jgi:tetratricopeptide (TPR) repeat protein
VPGAVALLVVCAAETVATRAYAAHWQDSIGLHEYLLTITPGSAILHSDLGAALAAAGRTGEALDHYRQAVQIEPRNALAHFNLGAELAKSEDTAKEAIAHYRQALETDSGFLNAHVNLVGALLAQGDVNEAIHHGEKAVEMNRAHVLVQYNLGKALLIGGRASEGLAHLRAALRLNPSFLLAARDLAWTLATHPDASTRDPNEALSLAQRAMAATQGRDVRVLDTLAAAYAANAQYGRAAETAEKALAMANRMRHPDLASEIEERLKLYELGCPYYENPRVPLDRILAQKSHPEHAPEAARLATRVKKSEVSDEAKALGSE